jgi:hypothetical protein
MPVNIVVRAIPDSSSRKKADLKATGFGAERSSREGDGKREWACDDYRSMFRPSRLTLHVLSLGMELRTCRIDIVRSFAFERLRKRTNNMKISQMHLLS